MELTGSGEPTVEELRRLVAMQGELVQSHAARVTALDAALEAALGPPTLRADDPETGAQEGDELRRSRAAFLKTAAAGLAGPPSSAWPAASRRRPKRVRPGRPPRALSVTGWSPSPTNPVRVARAGWRRSPQAACVGLVSAYEHAPARPTSSRGTTLHGRWVAKGGSAYAVSAVGLHMDARWTVLGGMTTHIAVTLAPGNDAFDGRFTFKAARPGGRVLGRGEWHAAPECAAAMSERARAEAREP